MPSSTRSASSSSPSPCRRCRCSSGVTTTARRYRARPTSSTSPVSGGTATSSSVNERGGCFVHGRSDAVLNRAGRADRHRRDLPGRRGRSRGPRPRWWSTSTCRTAGSSCRCSSPCGPGSSSTPPWRRGCGHSCAASTRPRHVPDAIIQLRPFRRPAAARRWRSRSAGVSGRGSRRCRGPGRHGRSRRLRRHRLEYAPLARSPTTPRAAPTLVEESR